MNMRDRLHQRNEVDDHGMIRRRLAEWRRLEELVRKLRAGDVVTLEDLCETEKFVAA